MKSRVEVRWRVREGSWTCALTGWDHRKPAGMLGGGKTGVRQGEKSCVLGQVPSPGARSSDEPANHYPAVESDADVEGEYSGGSCAVRSAAWVREAIIYEIFPRHFSKEGNFNGIIRQLPYLAKMGVNCLWLMPIHKIGLEARKGELGSPYSVYDYLSINPDYGNKETLRRLVDAVHSSGMRIIIDMVANHTSRDCPLVREHPDWYRRDWCGNIQSPVPDWYDVAQLNYDNPELRSYMLEVMRYWVREFDIDGYRCDVAALVPLDFWESVRRELRSIKPDVMLLAESHEPAHNARAFDITYEEMLPGVLVDVVRNGAPASRIRELLEWQAREFPKGALRLRYLENHDQERALTRIGRDAYGVSAMLFMTLDGVPLLYNGQEFGATIRPDLFNAPDGTEEPRDISIWNLYRDLCRIRRELRPLTRGSIEFLDTGHPRVLAFVRGMEGRRAVVILNFGNEPADVTFELPGPGEGLLFTVWFSYGQMPGTAAGEPATQMPVRQAKAGSWSGVRALLPGYGGHIFELYQAGDNML